KIFYIRRSGADAKGKLTSEGFVVLAGSKIRADIVPSCPDYVKTERKNNKDNIDENSIIKNEILFKSPSSSAAFV
ncbi:methionine sulfoxide reductase, partial [Longicatena sp. 210702-DFI.1.249]|nr:methionine sulfoxide reductase [Longicatena sp. 210702-DFI.1.249]